MPEFQPIFNYQPKWQKVNNTWIPVVDETTGLQEVEMIPQSTYHQIPWPCDDTVSLLVKNTWVNISKGWDDVLNPVSGRVWWISQNSSSDFTPRYEGDQEFTLKQDERKNFNPPEGTTLVSVYLNPHKYAVGYSFESIPR